MSPFNPNPQEPGLRIRLQPKGPFIDLGISHSELLVGVLDTLYALGGGTMHAVAPQLVTALENLNVHRPGKEPRK